MRYAAAIVTALVFSLTGIRKTVLSAERVKLLEQMLLLLVAVRGRLEYYRDPVGELIDILCETDGLKGLRFLEKCRRLEKSGMPFCEAWKKAVTEGGLSPPLKKCDVEQLLAAGAAIGTANLDSQLDKLKMHSDLLNGIIVRARSEADKNGRIYSSLGVSAGIIAGLMFL